MDILKNISEINEEDDEEEDDEDYVPSKEELDDADGALDKDDSSSGGDSDDDGEDGGDDGQDGKVSSKKKRRGRGGKKSQSKDDDAENLSKEKKDLSLEAKKKKADDLWAELCNSSSNKSGDSKDEVKLEPAKVDDGKAVKKVYDFAGETVVVEETSKTSVLGSSSASSSEPAKPASKIPTLKRSGLKDLLSNLGKKPRLGTLQKSKLDWDNFKQEEGITDEMKQATLSKDGFIERQAFLSRADLRQFEIEKSIRSKIRKPL